MHKCVRCGRAAASLQEINDGCPCGSKVFVFNKDAVEAGNDAAGAIMEKAATVAEAMPFPADGKAAPAGAAQGPPSSAGDAVSEKQDGRLPESYHARMTFTSEDVENIKVLTEGVFALSLQSLSRDPVVLKDEEGIYYVKIPFEQNEKALKKMGGNGKVGK